MTEKCPQRSIVNTNHVFNQIQAKSVLLRDLKQLRAKQASASATSQQPPAEPEPVLAQTKSPMAIDIGSSPPTAPAPAPAPEAAPEIKAEPAAETIDITSGTEDNKIDLEASLAGLTDTNFTDMEFAPPSEPTTFDMASFAPTDNATDLLSLENLMPAAGDGNTAPTDTTTTAAAAPSTSLDAEFADLFDNNDGQADGMDFDFSIGGGAGGTGGGGGGDDTFDDLMNTRGEDSFGMGGDDFDASFFGLDKPEGT